MVVLKNSLLRRERRYDRLHPDNDTSSPASNRDRSPVVPNADGASKVIISFNNFSILFLLHLLSPPHIHFPLPTPPTTYLLWIHEKAGPLSCLEARVIIYHKLVKPTGR